ncbi:MAG TPA: hypothetical protein VKZ85_06810 [Woeseiaceae bacterium]|nr:hypothetical protein [Woeseiaceae bacterium]
MPRAPTTTRPRITREPRILRRPARPLRRSDPDLPIGPLGIATIVVSLAFLLAGILWPQAASALLRLLLVTLALGFVASRAYRALLPVAATRSYSPFDALGAARTTPAAPHTLRKLTAELGAANDARRARHTAIPRPVRWAVIDEAARRLAEHHGLHLHDPDHHARIHALVSEPMWLLIDPGESSEPVPLSQLDVILDDLEKL